MDHGWDVDSFFNKLAWKAGLPRTLGRKKLGYSVLKLKFSAKSDLKRKPK